jgi:hypothetical protein
MANRSSRTRRSPAKQKSPSGKTKPAPRAKRAAKVRLLSGGNPQIAKADGDAPVQAWIDALPGWKVETARWFDRLVARAVPNVQ